MQFADLNIAHNQSYPDEINSPNQRDALMKTLLLLVVIVCAGCLPNAEKMAEIKANAKESEPKKMSAFKVEVEAKLYAKQVIADGLKYPSTAQFGAITVSQHGDLVLVNADVQSKNKAGLIVPARCKIIFLLRENALTLAYADQDGTVTHQDDALYAEAMQLIEKHAPAK